MLLSMEYSNEFLYLLYVIIFFLSTISINNLFYGKCAQTACEQGWGCREGGGEGTGEYQMLFCTVYVFIQ